MPSWSAPAGGGLSGRETVGRLARRTHRRAPFRDFLAAQIECPKFRQLISRANFYADPS